MMIMMMADVKIYLCISLSTLMLNLRRLERLTSPASNFDAGTRHTYSEWHVAALCRRMHGRRQRNRFLPAEAEWIHL